MRLWWALLLSGARIAAWWKCLAAAAVARSRAAIWSCVGTPRAIALCRYPFRFGRKARQDRVRGRIWRSNLVRTVGARVHVDPMRLDYPELARRRLVLESAVYHAEPALIAMMRECASRLESVTDELKSGGGIPVLAPFHFCSDVIATTVVALMEPRRTHVVAISAAGQYGSDEAAWYGKFATEIIKHHPDNPPACLRTILRDLRAGTANAVIFSDILPQFTRGYLRRTMRTRNVTLFDRPARLHCGAEDLARMVGGTLVPFYVYWQHGRLGIRIFEPCHGNGDGNGNGIAHCLEQALRECGDQWLLWHFPSLFYFNNGRAR